MPEEITNKISKIKDRMLGLDPNSMEYQHYSSSVRDLEKILKGTPTLKVHQTPELCESCQ